MSRFRPLALVTLVALAACESATTPLAPDQPTESASGIASMEAALPDPGTWASAGLDPSTYSNKIAGPLRLADGATRFTGTTAKLTGGINPMVQESGKISLSIDGMGTTGTSGTVQVQKPVGGSVRGAYIATAANWGSGPQPNGSVSVNGSPVTWQQTVHINPPASHWADVTAILKPTLDAAAPGIVDVAIGESTAMEGTILAVIFDDPNQTTDNTVALLFGAQRLSGDNFYLGLAAPLDKSDPNLIMDLSLGISFGYQVGTSGGQHSIVNVNGVRLTTSAGGQDDGLAANGALITVGGVGDTNANPVPATSFCGNGPRCDDELYNLVPLLANGSQQISVFTQNPSNDDNMFFAAFFLSVSGQVVTQAPAATAGPDQVVEAPATFTLDGSGSFDGDGTIVSYEWTENGNPIGNTAILSGLSRPVGSYTFVLKVTDNDGLSDTDEVVVEVVPPADATPPAISYALSGATGDNGWYVGPVTITWTVTDPETAVTSTAGCESVTTSTDGTGYSFTCSATSTGGTAEVTSDPFNLDQTAPAVSYTLAGVLGNDGWYVGAVTTSWTVDDGGSGVAQGCTDTTESQDGTGYLSSCTATDVAGNATTVTTAPFRIDQTPPTLTYALSGQLGGNGWYVGPVTVTWTADDALSGMVATCAPETEADDGTGNTFSCTVSDNAGNGTSATTSAFDIDQTPPTVAYAGNAGSYDVSETIAITCSTADNLSGVATDTCADVGADAWTFALGSHTLAAEAVDVAGNVGAGSTSFEVTVSYDGLCALVRRFVSNAGVANSLCVKLDAAARAQDRGQTGTRDNVLEAFINEVVAQQGKKVPAAAAPVLTTLALALMS